MLYRHLVNQPGIELEILLHDNNGRSLRNHFNKFIERVTKTRILKWAYDIKTLMGWCFYGKDLPNVQKDNKMTLVLTVAHGEMYSVARKYAKIHSLPLVTFFHDWWPDILNVHEWMRPVIEWNFRKLYRDSDLVFCVSRRMREMLGAHSNARVLLPIPATKTTQDQAIEQIENRRENIFRILYFGNLFDYGKMIACALVELRGHTSIRLEVRGDSCYFSPDFAYEMTQSGNLLPFLARDKISQWLLSADAFLVPQSFEADQRRRMETNFPSKMPEYAQFGKPIVIWGPEYGSAAQFAREKKMALVVSDPNPIALRNELKLLAASQDDQYYYAQAATKAAVDEFNPLWIQRYFLESLAMLKSTQLNKKTTLFNI